MAHNSKGTPRDIYYKYFENFNPFQTTELKIIFLYTDLQFLNEDCFKFSYTLYFNAYVNCDVDEFSMERWWKVVGPVAQSV